MTRERIASFPEDDWRGRSSDYREPNLTQNLAVADLMSKIGARHGVSAGVVAIAWTLRKPEVTGAIVGARRPEQIEGITPAADFRLSEEEIREIEEIAPAALASEAAN